MCRQYKASPALTLHHSATPLFPTAIGAGGPSLAFLQSGRVSTGRILPPFFHQVDNVFSFKRLQRGKEEEEEASVFPVSSLLLLLGAPQLLPLDGSAAPDLSALCQAAGPLRRKGAFARTLFLYVMHCALKPVGKKEGKTALSTFFIVPFYQSSTLASVSQIL